MNTPAEEHNNGGRAALLSDPTQRTVEQLQREIAALKELLMTRVSGVEEAQKSFREDMVRVPTAVQQQVGGLKELHERWFAEQFSTVNEKFKTVDEKFESVSAQFTGRDTAVAAALQAQKEAAGEQNKSNTIAIDKSEAGMKEQIGQQRELQQTNYRTLDDKVVTLDTRITRIESLAIGRVTEQTTHATVARDDRSLIFGAIAALAILVTLIDKFVK